MPFQSSKPILAANLSLALGIGLRLNGLSIGALLSTLDKICDNIAYIKFFVKYFY